MNLFIFVGIILMVVLFLFLYCACIISSRYSRLEEEEGMSILQEYEENEKIIGKGKVRAINDYIDFCAKINRSILYSDIVYKREEYNKFENWFKYFIKPFRILKHSDLISVHLSEENFCYDWLEEKKYAKDPYSNGYYYDDLFKNYIEKNFADLSKRLNYDSESGMFCVYCANMKDAEEVIYELAKLYRDEKKMIELIKDYKELKNILFSI